MVTEEEEAAATVNSSSCRRLRRVMFNCVTIIDGERSDLNGRTVRAAAVAADPRPFRHLSGTVKLRPSPLVVVVIVGPAAAVAGAEAHKQSLTITESNALH